MTDIIALVCPKCGAPLTEGRTTKCQYCGTSFLIAQEQSTPKVIEKPTFKTFTDPADSPSDSPSTTASGTESLSISYSVSLSASPSPSPSAEFVSAKEYSEWRRLSGKVERFRRSLIKKIGDV